MGWDNEHATHDPLDRLKAHGIRVVWAPNLDRRVILVQSHDLAVADAVLSRDDAARRVLSLLGRRPDRS